MAVKVRYKTRRAGINEVVRSDFMLRECERRADNVVGLGQQIAPVRTGAYRAMIHRRSGIRARGAWAQAIAGARYSWWVERGNSLGAPAQQVMARVLHAARD
jgi:hypothetical protein